MRYTRLSLTVLWSVLAVLCVILMGEAYYQYPIMDGDAIDFLPHAISYAHHGTLIDPFAKNFDSTGQGRLVYHGFLMEIVSGKMCPSSTYPALRMVLTSINIASIVLLLIFLTALPKQSDMEAERHGTLLYSLPPSLRLRPTQVAMGVLRCLPQPC